MEPSLSALGVGLRDARRRGTQNRCGQRPWAGHSRNQTDDEAAVSRRCPVRYWSRRPEKRTPVERLVRRELLAGARYLNLNFGLEGVPFVCPVELLHSVEDSVDGA